MPLALLLAGLVGVLALRWTDTDPAGAGSPRPGQASPAARDERAIPPLEIVDAAVPEAVPIAPAAAVTGTPMWHGLVLDVDGRPLAGARVGRLPMARRMSFMSHGPQPENAALFEQALWSETGADGTFEIAWAEPAAETDWALLVRHPTAVACLVACKDALAAGGDCGTLRLARGGVLRGRVLAWDGSPAAGADVDASLQTRTVPLLAGDPNLIVGLYDGLLHARTDDDGRFELGGLPPAAFTLAVEHLGHATLRTDAITVVPEPDVDLGDLRLQRGNTVSGRVLDAQDRPIVGAEVRATASGLELVRRLEHGIHWELEKARTAQWGMGDRHDARACVVTSDADGRFELGGMQRATCAVLAVGPGFEPAAQDDVPAGTRDLVLRLQPLGHLRLRLVDAMDGQPIAGAELQVQSVGGRQQQAVGDRDRLPVERLPSGEFLVSDVCDAPLVASIRSPQLGFASLRIDGLEPGMAEAVSELPVPRPASIAGRVLDSAGLPVTTARVSFQPYSGDLQAVRIDRFDVAVDEAGRFQSGPIPADDWMVWAGEAAHSSTSARRLLAPGEDVDVGDLVLMRPARLDARLVDAAGAARPGVQVSLVAADAPVGSPLVLAAGATDSEGAVHFVAPPGGMRFESRDPPIVVDLGTLAEGETRALLVQPQQPARLSGTLRDASGPVAEARIDVRGGFRPVRTTTGPDGTWSLDVAATPSVRVVARSAHGGVVAQTLALLPGEARVVDLQLGTEHISGRIVDVSTGAPAAGAAVQAWRGNQELMGPSVKSDGSGHFNLEGLEPGAWTVQGGGEPFTFSAEVGVDLPADAPRELLIEVTRLGRMAGTVRTADGAAVGRGECTVYLAAVGESEHADVDFPGDDGTYSFERIAPGDYELLVARGLNGHEHWFGSEDARRLAWVRTAVRIEPGADLQQDAVLPPGKP
ncbi:MAG TPA: carboxypeptidase-like regulatory domain-containing protein [Planctomycetota bacterium]|nr:carboxypeptidase-like regulatory domain-containing protein [Planctomycetota bacterium]